MVFSSPIFLFFFLPLVFMAVMLVPRRHANTVLVLASLLFYAWGEGELVVIMLLSIVSNYLFGLAIGARAGQRGGRLYLACGIAFNLGLLGLFKYLNFVVDNLNVLLGLLGAAPIMLSPVHLPIGISFFSFQALSYLVDTYRGDCAPQRSLKNLALYITMFPQLIAGPIIRYRQIAEQIEHRVLSYPKALAGAERFIVGLFKKMMIANTLGAVADLVFAQPYGSLPVAAAWLGAVAYSFQIYFDFSGYSDMAIGLCLLFGFSIPENFRYPYTASSVREFWRRWHISLTTWMRDYLYIPLGGNRVSPARLYLNLFTVFLLTGFWHGARWNFLAWGAYHGAFLVAERILFTRKASAPLRVLGHAYTIVVVIFGWVVFRTDTLPEAAAYMQAMLGMSQPEAGPATLGHLFNRMNYMALALALLASAPVYPAMRGAITMARDAAGLSRWARFILAHSHYALLMSLFLASCLLVAIGTYNPFIYFRF